jgi:hypothetical protein
VTSPLAKASSSLEKYARTNAKAPASSAGETNGVAEAVGEGMAAADVVLRPGGGVAPF